MAANKFAVALAAMASAGLIATFPAAMARAGNVDRFGVKEIYRAKLAVVSGS